MAAGLSTCPSMHHTSPWKQRHVFPAGIAWQCPVPPGVESEHYELALSRFSCSMAEIENEPN